MSSGKQWSHKITDMTHKKPNRLSFETGKSIYEKARDYMKGDAYEDKFSWWDYAIENRRNLKKGKYSKDIPSRGKIAWDAFEDASWLTGGKGAGWIKGKFPKGKIPKSKIPKTKIPKSKIPKAWVNKADDIAEDIVYQWDRLGNIMIPW